MQPTTEPELPIVEPETTDGAATPTASAPIEPDPVPARPALEVSRFYWPLLLLITAIYARFPLTGVDDFWAHAAIGRWIWQHGEIPRQTLFLWSTEPVPWVAHSWLSQWMFYFWMWLGGPRFGPYIAVGCTILLVVATFWVVWCIWTRRARLTFLAPLFFLFGIWLSVPRFHPRPELFTAFFTALLLSFLVAWREEDEVPTLENPVTLPGGLQIEWRLFLAGLGFIPLFAIWANFHGAVAYGIVLLGMTVVVDLLQNRGDKRSLALLVLAILCGLATAINPYGFEYWQALRSVNSQTFHYIDEWKRPWVKPAMPVGFIIGEVALALLALLAWAANARRRWVHGLWVLFMLVSFLNARRNLWMLALVCLVVLAANASVLDTNILWRRWRALTQSKDPVLARMPIPAGLRTVARLGAIICLILGLLFATPRDFLQWRAVNRKKVPDAMANFIQRNRLYVRVFNDYEYSSYLQWRFAGKPPLYIDLLNAYGDQLILDYFEVLKVSKRGQQILDGGKQRRRIDVVMLRTHKKRDGLDTLAKWLTANPRWARVYKGVDGQIWLRRLPAYRHIWRKAGLNNGSRPKSTSPGKAAS